MRKKYRVRLIVSTDKLKFNQVDQRTSVALHGQNIVWAICSGALQLRTRTDEKLFEVFPHKTHIWWIQIEGDFIYSISQGNPVMAVTKITNNGQELEVVKTVTVALEGQMWVLSGSEEHIVTGDSGGNVYFWNKLTYEFVRKIELYRGLFSVVYNNGLFFGSMVTAQTYVAFDSEGRLMQKRNVENFAGCVTNWNNKGRTMVASNMEILFIEAQTPTGCGFLKEEATSTIPRAERTEAKVEPVIEDEEAGMHPNCISEEKYLEVFPDSNVELVDFMPKLNCDPYEIDEMICHEFLLWCFCRDTRKFDSEIAVLVFDKFTRKQLFQFVLFPDIESATPVRSRIFEFVVRHDICVLACGGFSFIVETDETAEAEEVKREFCLIS
jgi:hypothetical protein